MITVLVHAQHFSREFNHGTTAKATSPWLRVQASRTFLSLMRLALVCFTVLFLVHFWSAIILFPAFARVHVLQRYKSDRSTYIHTAKPDTNKFKQIGSTSVPLLLLQTSQSINHSEVKSLPEVNVTVMFYRSFQHIIAIYFWYCDSFNLCCGGGF